jgi:hypothetical protein
MEDVLVPWGGRVKFSVFQFWAMFQSLVDDPRLHKKLTGTIHQVSLHMIRITLIRSIPWNGIMIHTSFSYNIQDGMFVVLCGLLFSLDHTNVARNDCQGIECLFSLFQSSLRSLGTDHGYGTLLGSCLNSRRMIPKDRMPLHFTVSFLSYYEVCKRPTHLEVSSQMCWDLMAFNEP